MGTENRDRKRQVITSYWPHCAVAPSRYPKNLHDNCMSALRLASQQTKSDERMKFEA